jgi:hypothetical protein
VRTDPEPFGASIGRNPVRVKRRMEKDGVRRMMAELVCIFCGGEAELTGR